MTTYEALQKVSIYRSQFLAAAHRLARAGKIQLTWCDGKQGLGYSWTDEQVAAMIEREHILHWQAQEEWRISAAGILHDYKRWLERRRHSAAPARHAPLSARRVAGFMLEFRRLHGYLPRNVQGRWMEKRWAEALKLVAVADELERGREAAKKDGGKETA